MNCDTCHKPLGPIRIKIGKSYYHDECLHGADPPAKRQKLELIPGNQNASEKKKVPAATSIVETLLKMTLDRMENPNFKPRIKTIKLAQEILDQLTGKRL